MKYHEPETLEAALELARVYVASGLFPAVRSPEMAVTLFDLGGAVGLSPVQSLRSIYVMDGKPVMAAAVIIGAAKRSEDCRWFRLVESTSELAIYETQRGSDPSPTRFTYTIEDAKRAGLAGRKVWQQYPAAMLRARCASALASLAYPDAVAGLVSDDEEDGPAAPEPTSAPKLEPKPEPTPSPKPEAKSADEMRAARAEHGTFSHELRRDRAEQLKGCSVREAAKVAGQGLAARGKARDTVSGAIMLRDIIEKRGKIATDASIEDVLDAWMHIDP